MNPVIVIVCWVVTFLIGWFGIGYAFRTHDQLDRGIMKAAKVYLMRAWLYSVVCLMISVLLFLSHVRPMYGPGYLGLGLAVFALLMITQAHRRLADGS